MLAAKLACHNVHMSTMSPFTAGPATAMLLAAGRGERMRPLTDHTPKPLLVVQGQPLLVWHLRALARAGHRHVLINTAWLEEQIPALLGHTFEGMAISYSMEGRDCGGALETAGGMARALPLLAPCFWVVAGDVFAPDFDFATPEVQAFERSTDWAHLWLVPNPPHHPTGDFGISQIGPIGRALHGAHVAPRYTYSTIGLYRHALVSQGAAAQAGLHAGNAACVKTPLAPLLRAAMDNGVVGASLYTGRWTDVGTPERLAQLNELPH
jgi:N-acetyl-alpha-D-muramate 1-phosphate uridylyltransferase